MENRVIFREMLGGIREAADRAGGSVTRAEVREILADMPLEEEHFALIYEYLEGEGIRVLDSREEKPPEPPAEAAGGGSLAAYLREMVRLQRGPAGDEHALLRRVMQGDAEARQRLIESWLPMICAAAENYGGDEILPEDLIQEGNLGLLEALGAAGSFDSPAAYGAHILNSVNEAMARAVESGSEKRRLGEHLVSRVNHLNEAVKNLERDLGHKVSAEEVSAYLEMPLAEIRDLLRMSGDQIELEGEGPAGSGR